MWTDMNAVVYHGTTPSRNMIQEYELYYKDEEVNIVILSVLVKRLQYFEFCIQK